MLPGDKNSDNNETDNAVTSNAVTALPGVPALRSYTAELVLDASPQRNTNLKMLSEELERQTKVTQKLQERVEQATKLTMERMEHTIGRVTSGASTSLRLHSSDVPSQLKVPEAQSLSQNSGVLPDSCDLDILFHNMNYTRKDTVEEYSQKVSELQRQLSKTHEHHKKQNAYLRQCIMKLQTKLHESQIEMDALLELRMKESQGQADLVGKLQQTIGELQARKQAGDQRLLDAEERAQSLCRKKEALELSLQEVISVLMVYEKGSGRNTYVVQHAASPDQLSLGAAVGSVLKDLEAENVSLRGRILPMEEQLEALKLECQGKIVLMMKEQTERMNQILTSHDQEVAVLTDKLSSSQGSAANLLAQMKQLQRQAEEQTSVYQSQMTDLESALSSLRSELLEAQQTHKDKVVTLENLLAEVASRLEDTQRESNLEIQKAKDMDSRLCQATAELQQAREELALEKEQNRRLGERDRSHGLAIEGLRKELEAQSQGASELESLVASLKEECQSLKGKQVAVEKQQSEMQEEAAHLHGKLKEARDLLEEREHEKEKLQALLKREEREGKRLRAQLEEQEQKGKRLKALLEEQRHKAKRLHELQVEKECEEKRLQELLQEKENEEKRLQKLLEERGLELQEGQGQLEETQEQAQALRVEGDSLRLKLEDRQQTVDLLQLQVEGMTQLSLQHSQSINTLQEEREWLVSEIDKHKLVVQQLKEGLEQRDNMLRALEQEQLQQKATMSEKTRNLKELMLDKKQLTGKLEVQHTQLVTLTEELESLKKTHSSKIEELEGIAAKLRAQLHTVRADLYQAKSTLRTLEGADEHGMKVAMGMQRRITAKREQIDTLQGRIQLLEETTDKLTQEKQQQAAERRRQSQELSAVSAEKKQLEAEVEALHCNEKQLRDKVSKLEAALDKMAERFTECQDFMQQQEQEYMRLKLQHALDVKELQGEKLRASGNLRQTAFCNPPLTTQLLRSQSFSGQCQQNNPTRELRSLVKELRSVIDEDDRSSPIISKSPKDRPYTSDLEPLTLHTADLDKGIMNNTFFSNGCEVSFTVPPRYTSSPRGLALGQRSPVHSLLTSCPHPAAPLQAHLEKGPFTDFHTRKVCKRLQGKLDNLESIVGDLQSKAQEMSSMIKTEETKMGRVKDRSKLSNGLSYV